MSLPFSHRPEHLLLQFPTSTGSPGGVPALQTFWGITCLLCLPTTASLQGAPVIPLAQPLLQFSFSPAGWNGAPFLCLCSWRKGEGSLAPAPDERNCSRAQAGPDARLMEMWCWGVQESLPTPLHDLKEATYPQHPGAHTSLCKSTPHSTHSHHLTHLSCSFPAILSHFKISHLQ